jgi:hypothetical protein
MAGSDAVPDLLAFEIRDLTAQAGRIAETADRIARALEAAEEILSRAYTDGWGPPPGKEQ